MKLLKKVKKIIIHHSLTEDGKIVNWKAIENFHKNERKWEDIGYHAGIELIGNEYFCLFGRPTYFVGAHTEGQNYDSLGFCFIGNYDLISPPIEMLEIASYRVLCPWIKQYNLDIDNIYGHRDFSSKTCPGSKFDLNVLKDIISDVLKKYF